MVAFLPIAEGTRFGRWTIGQRAPNRNGKSFYTCRCECGTTKEIHTYILRTGETQSCGCLRSELTVKRLTTHGLSNTRTNRTFYGMHDRCSNPKSFGWKWYGARGIRVCKRWDKFANFLADMGEKPEGLTLDRIDVDGDYKPGNCRWATYREQRMNQRRMPLHKRGI